MHLRHVQIRVRDPARIVFSPGSVCFLTRALYAMLQCLVYDWVRLDTVFHRAYSVPYHPDDATNRDKLQPIMDILGHLQCAFEAFAVRASSLANHEDAEQLTEAAYPGMPLFDVESSNSSLLECDVAATPTHLDSSADRTSTSGPPFEMPRFLVKDLEDVGIAFCAVNEDMTQILQLCEGKAHGITTNSDALMELWRIADHSERHCDIARQAIQIVRRDPKSV